MVVEAWIEMGVVGRNDDLVFLFSHWLEAYGLSEIGRDLRVEGHWAHARAAKCARHLRIAETARTIMGKSMDHIHLNKLQKNKIKSRTGKKQTKPKNTSTHKHLINVQSLTKAVRRQTKLSQTVQLRKGGATGRRSHQKPSFFSTQIRKVRSE